MIKSVSWTVLNAMTLVLTQSRGCGSVSKEAHNLGEYMQCVLCLVCRVVMAGSSVGVSRSIGEDLRIELSLLPEAKL